jgi:hypothetical protein
MTIYTIGVDNDDDNDISSQLQSTEARYDISTYKRMHIIERKQEVNTAMQVILARLPLSPDKKISTACLRLG